MLSHLRAWRERGWTVIDAPTYATVWQQYGGSVATHPQVIERLAGLVDIPVRYLGWQQDGNIVAAVGCWGRDLALAKKVLKQRDRRFFDLGNAEIILPVALGAKVPVRQRMNYVSELNAGQIATLKPQAESLAIARAPEDYSKKFRYNQRREQRLLEEAGGVVQPMLDFSSEDQARIYSDLFHARWGFDVPGKDHLASVFELMREFMTGSMILLEGKPIAAQVLYRVESPNWVSVEYINGGVDPAHQALSAGSVLSFVNTQNAWTDARAVNKPLRYSFGRADREYKDRWCQTVPVYRVG
jgi:hypothetical protein